MSCNDSTSWNETAACLVAILHCAAFCDTENLTSSANAASRHPYQCNYFLSSQAADYAYYSIRGSNDAQDYEGRALLSFLLTDFRPYPLQRL